MINIVGHKNPDTDSICSALAYADFLKEGGLKAQAWALGDPNKETKFVLDYFRMAVPKIIQALPPSSRVVLVDHNERGQAIDNLEELELQEIIDHHKVNLQTEKPIEICVRPWGSTCSIIADRYQQTGKKPQRSIAGLLIAGIISDTLFFRSPTTTDYDRRLVENLNQIVGIDDLEKFSLDMFEAKSDLGDLSTEELIKLDYKEFDFKDGRYGIGVMETTNVDYGLSRLLEIQEKLKEIRRKENLKAVYFVIVDILRQQAYVISSDEEAERLFKRLFSAREKSGVLFVDKLVSRKKQIVPIFEGM